MNEKINELAEQAGMGPWGIGNGYEPDGIVKKFAELIVGECTDLVQKYMTRWPEDHELTKQIKEHFGVEE